MTQNKKTNILSDFNKEKTLKLQQRENTETGIIRSIFSKRVRFSSCNPFRTQPLDYLERDSKQSMAVHGTEHRRWHNSCLQLKSFGTHLSFQSHLCKQLTHLLCDCIFFRGIFRWDNVQENSHYPGNAQRQARRDHSLHQKCQTLERQRLYSIQVDDRRLERHLYPRSHHKQFPNGHRGIPPPFPRRLYSHQPVSKFELR